MMLSAREYSCRQVQGIMFHDCQIVHHRLNHWGILLNNNNMPTELSMIEALFKNAREELMKRVEFRDGHLKQCLVSLVVIYALGEGIKFAGVESANAKGELYSFAFPVSFLFLSLYMKEENLIGSLSSYVNGLSEQWNSGKAAHELEIFWDDSVFVRKRIVLSMVYRLFSTTITFFALPGILVGVYLYRERQGHVPHPIVFWSSIWWAVASVLWLFLEFLLRLKRIKQDAAQRPRVNMSSALKDQIDGTAGANYSLVEGDEQPVEPD